MPVVAPEKLVSLQQAAEGIRNVHQTLQKPHSTVQADSVPRYAFSPTSYAC